MLYFLLPAYNEGAGILLLLETIHTEFTKRDTAHQIYVVNDGSRDDTLEVLKKNKSRFPLTILNHETNQGVGMAFKTGFKALFEVLKPDDIVVTMDADNTHKMKTVELMLARLQDGYDVVIASMFTTGGMMVGAPFYRYLLTYACNFIYRVLFHVKGIREYTGFFRAYSGEALLRLHQHFGDQAITTSTFACMAEFLVKCRRVAMLMTEVPMILRYDQKTSVSSLKIVPTISAHLEIMTANLFDRKIF